MTWLVYLFILVAYSVGNLSDDTTAWASVKLVFSIALLVAMVLTAKRDITTAYRGEGHG